MGENSRACEEKNTKNTGFFEKGKKDQYSQWIGQDYYDLRNVSYGGDGSVFVVDWLRILLFTEVLRPFFPWNWKPLLLYIEHC